MSNATRMLAKAVSRESRSEAIVVSFGSEWYDSLRGKRFTAVIRKRVPSNFQPRFLYFHMNSPRSAICARAEILSVEVIDRARALEIRHELDLSEEQILRYFGALESMGCYRLGQIFFPDSDVTSEQIAAHMVYHPPQSFFVLSNDAKDLLDRLCGIQKDSAITRKASSR